MASLKSMVYVVFGRSESFSSIFMRLPAPFISGGSSCGGLTTTFSCWLSNFMNSSKNMLMLRDATPVDLSAGDVCSILGGVSSNHPPSGCPIFAQE